MPIKAMNSIYGRKNYLIIVSYFLVFNIFLTGVLTAILYIYSYKKLENETLLSNKNRITQLKSGINVIQGQIDKFLTQIVLDQPTANFMEYYKNSNYKMQINITTRLYNFIISNEYIDSINIFYLDENMILAVGSGVFDIDDFYDTDLVSRIKNNTIKYGWMPVRHVFNKEKDIDKDVITIVRPIPIISAEPSAIIIVNIKENYIRELIKSIGLLESEDTLIVNREGEVLSHIDKSKLYEDIKSKEYFTKSIQDKSGQYTVKINNIYNLVSYVQSDDLEWKYISVTPYSIITDKISFIRNFFIFIFAINIFLVILISLFLAGKINKPILSIAKLLSTNNFNYNDSNIYSSIEKNINSLIEKKDELQKTLIASKPILINNFILSILKGNIRDRSEIIERLEYYELDIQKHLYYVVYIISIDDYKKYISQYSEKQKNMLSIFLKQVISKALDKYSNCIVIDGEFNEIVAIANFSDEGNAFHIGEMIKAIGKEIHEEIIKNMSFTATIGIGNIYKEISCIHESYHEAKECLLYTVILGNNRVIQLNELNNYKEYRQGYPFRLEQELLNALSLGDIETIEVKLNKIFQYIIQFKESPDEYTSYVSIQLLCSTLNFIYEMGINGDEICETKNVFEELLRLKNLQERCNWFTCLYNKIAKYILAKKDSRNIDVIKIVEKYILENYEKDLSLNTLGEMVYLSGPYLSKIFKEFSGQSLKKYINQIRIEKAKELLRDSDYMIDTIAKKVGYDNVRSFMKIFKSNLGVTPGEYRKSLLHEKEL